MGKGNKDTANDEVHQELVGDAGCMAVSAKPEQANRNKVDFDGQEPTPSYTSGKDTDELIHALTLFLLAHLQLAGSADRELEPLNMHRTHHRILYFCARCPGHTVGDLVRTLRLTPQAVQAPMKMLVKKGWIEQRRSTIDKRQRQLFITPLGREMHRQIAHKQFAILSEARQSVGEQAFTGFMEAMRALARKSDLLLFDEETRRQ